MKSRINREAREISISELWWYVVSKWKWLVIGMVVGALLFGVYGAYSAYRANGSEKTNVPNEYTMEDLTPEEQAAINALLEDYDVYLEEAERVKNNYLMKLDYNSLPYYTVSYYINTNYSYNYLEVKEDYTDELVYLYKTFLQGDEVNQKILDLNIEGLELIDLNYLRTVANEGDVIKIAFVAGEEECKKIVNVLCEEIEKYNEYATDIVGEHELTKISEDSTYAYGNLIKDIQNLRMAELNALYMEIASVKENFNERQKYVFDELVSVENTDIVISETSENKSMLDIMKITIGALLGIIIMVVVNVFIYISGRKIRSFSEISQVYNVEIVEGFIRNDVSGKYFIRKINSYSRMGDENEQKEYVVEVLREICEMKRIKELAICSSLNISDEAIYSQLKFLDNVGIKTEFIGNVNTDVKALKDIMKYKNVLFVEQINVTSKRCFEKQIELCDQFSINILGVVAIA